MDRPRLHTVKPEGPTPEELAQKAEREKFRRQVAALQLLQQHEGWAVYREMLEDFEKNAMQALLINGKDHHDHWAGYINGLRTAFGLPDTLAQKMRELT